MGNIRIHELAKEIGVESRQVLDYLKNRGIGGKTASSGVDETQAAAIRKDFSSGSVSGKKTGEEKKVTDKKETVNEKAGAEKSTAEKAGAEKSTDKAPKKKKRLIAVFHPQNATSKEGKNFHQNGQKDRGEKKQRGRDGRNASSSRNGENGRVVAESSRGGRPVGSNKGKTGTPLVHVPRPHGVIRNENPKPPVSYDPKPVVEKPKPQPEVKKPEETVSVNPSVASEAAKPAAPTAAKAAAPEVQKAPETAAEVRKPAENAAQHEETKPVTAGAEKAAEKPAESPKAQEDTNRDNGERSGHGARENRRDRQKGFSDRGNGGRNAGDHGDRNDRSDRNGQNRGFGNRNDRGDRNGQNRGFGNRNDRGDRNGQNKGFGNRNDRGGQGRPAGNGRPGQGFRPGFGGRPGQGRFGDKDREEEGNNRFASRGRNNQRNDRKGTAPAMDMGIKKSIHDSHSKDKDKSKEDLRGNKYTNDRRQGRGNNHNKQLIPKALQKPVHKKEEKKEEKVTEIKIPDKLTIRELAEKMKMQPAVIVKDLFMKGEMYTVNQEVDYDKAEEIAMNYDILCDHEEQVDVIAEMLKEDEEDESKMVPRPPVVCVMGHVDHGKTSLLDAIRHAHVTDREAGGITQNIGAYSVQINGRKITFLDTPGHEAFTAMRMRGANATDIAVLVVAADDGVMPQTIEAINHAKAANVEIIVAINKIDKPGANVDRVKQELTEYGLVASDWGGQTEMVEVSAKTKQGIDDLLETILLTADIMELKANPDRLARGIVLEAKLDKGKGPVANLLVQKGTLHVGDYIACGASSGKVRAMTDENGKRVRSAGPSTPVEVQGLDGVPDAGETLVAMETDKEAKNFAATFVNEHKNQLLEETKSRMSLDALFDQIQDGSVKELEIVLKADVQGSVEALRQALLKLSNDEVVIKIIHAGVGAINESDITLAAASNAIVIGFNVRPDQTAKALADEEKVDVRLYKVIYAAIDDITNAMTGMLEPVYEEKVIGHAEIRQLFKASGVGTIGGAMVLDGVVQRNCKARITRGKKQIFDGNLASLKRFKDDVKEVKAGYECGLVFEGFNDLAEGDQVEAYAMVEVPRDQLKKKKDKEKAAE